jgi:hypothetical protein
MKFFRENTDCIYSSGPKETLLNPNIIENTKTRIDGGVISKTIIHGRGKDLVKIQKRMDHVHTWWTLKHFCDDIDDLEVYVKTLPDLLKKVDTNDFHKIDEELGNNGIIMISVPDPLCIVADSFDFGEFMIYAMTETDRIKKAHDAIYEYQTYHFDQIVNSGIENMMVRIYGPEYATEPYLPPKLYYDYGYIKGDPFPWLFIDFENLAFFAEQYGFKAELIYEDEHYNYLGRISRKMD